MSKDWGAWVQEGRAEARRDAMWMVLALSVAAIAIAALMFVVISG